MEGRVVNSWWNSSKQQMRNVRGFLHRYNGQDIKSELR